MFEQESIIRLTRGADWSISERLGTGERKVSSFATFLRKQSHFGLDHIWAFWWRPTLSHGPSKIYIYITSFFPFSEDGDSELEIRYFYKFYLDNGQRPRSSDQCCITLTNLRELHWMLSPYTKFTPSEMCQWYNTSCIWYVSQNYWVFGLRPSSGILETIKHNVSETGLFPSPGEGGGKTTTLLSPLERANLMTEWWRKSKNPVIRSIIHHRQNPSASNWNVSVLFPAFIFSSRCRQPKTEHAKMGTIWNLLYILADCTVVKPVTAMCQVCSSVLGCSLHPQPKYYLNRWIKFNSDNIYSPTCYMYKIKCHCMSNMKETHTPNMLMFYP
jgi:hypothetical protein